MEQTTALHNKSSELRRATEASGSTVQIYYVFAFSLRVFQRRGGAAPSVLNERDHDIRTKHHPFVAADYGKPIRHRFQGRVDRIVVTCAHLLCVFRTETPYVRGHQNFFALNIRKLDTQAVDSIFRKTIERAISPAIKAQPFASAARGFEYFSQFFVKLLAQGLLTAKNGAMSAKCNCHACIISQDSEPMQSNTDTLSIFILKSFILSPTGEGTPSKEIGINDACGSIVGSRGRAFEREEHDAIPTRQAERTCADDDRGYTKNAQ